MDGAISVGDWCYLCGLEGGRKRFWSVCPVQAGISMDTDYTNMWCDHQYILHMTKVIAYQSQELGVKVPLLSQVPARLVKVG